jgi:WD40 repeat protein
VARIGTVRFRHASNGVVVAFTENGKALAGYDHETLRIWNASNGKELCRFAGIPPELVIRGEGCVISPDRKLSATIGPSHELWLRDIVTNRVIRVWNATGNHFSNVAFSLDSKRLAAGCFGRVQVWDVPSGKEVNPVPEHRDDIRFMVLSPDGKTVMTEGHDPALPGKEEKGIDGRHINFRFWDAATGRKLPAPAHQQFHFPPPLEVAPDGKSLVCRNKGGDLQLWNVRTGKLVRILPHDAPETTCAYSPNGRFLVSRRWGGGLRQDQNETLWLWDAVTGKELGRLEGHKGLVWLSRFSPDGEYLVSCGLVDDTVRIWEVSSRRQVRKLALDTVPLSNFAFSPDGRLLVGAGGDSKPFQLWEVASGSEVRVPNFKAIQARQKGSGYGLVFMPNGRYLITEESYGKLFCWDLANGQLKGQWIADSPIHKLALSTSGKVLVSQGRSALLVWNLAGLVADDPAPSIPLRENELKALWVDLASPDATKGYQAVWRLSQSPEHAVPFLRGQLSAAKTDKSAMIARLVATLDSDSFTERNDAERRLQTLGSAAEAELRRALGKQPSPELRMRAQRLLRRLPDSGETLSPDELRALRSIAILEQVGTRQATQILETLAKGADNNRITQAARASLKRREVRSPRMP